MKTFFQNFPKIPIRVNNQVIFYDDYFRFVDVNELYLNNLNNYNFYEIENAERPDQVSQKLYETTEYYWTFFIINDRLKNGMKEWPLSSSQFNRYILDEYGNFSVCELMPNIFPLNIDMMTTNFRYDMMGGREASADLMEDDAKFVFLYTLLHGLDLTHKWLRVFRVDSVKSELLGEIEKFDSSRWQLWLKNVEDAGFFETNLSNNDIAFKLINPYPENSPEYNEVEEENKIWLEKVSKEWYPFHFPSFNFNEQNIQSEIESKMVFDVRTFYPMAENAPDYYFDLSTEEKITSIDAQLLQKGIPKTFREVEEELNESKRKIKVLRPEVIYEFENKYNKVLKNTNRLSFS